MDYVFSRLQTGYDAIVLAYRQENGQYETYLLGKNKGQEKFMFRTEQTQEANILALVKEWVGRHLTKDDQLVLLEQCQTIDQYHHRKHQLTENEITYEVKGRAFYIRQGDRGRLDTP